MMFGAVEKADGRQVPLKPRTAQLERVTLESGDIIGLGEARIRFARSEFQGSVSKEG